MVSVRPTIVVLAHKRSRALAECLDAIRRSEEVENHNTVLVIDGHDEAVLDIISKYPEPKVLVRIDNPVSATPRSRILRSLSYGLTAAFEMENSQYAVVIEDDIVVSPDFLRGVAALMAAHSGHRLFRAVNGFGLVAPEVPGALNSYSRLSYGVGWGWALPRRTYETVKKIFAVGSDADIWDGLIEPYLRTGYVVNFRRSRVRNIGFDALATHTNVASDSDLGFLLDQSFVGESAKGQLVNPLISSKDPFFWREDAVALDRLAPPMRLGVYLVGWLGWGLQCLRFFLGRNPQSRFLPHVLSAHRFIRKRVFPFLGRLSGSQVSR